MQAGELFRILIENKYKIRQLSLLLLLNNGNLRTFSARCRAGMINMDDSYKEEMSK